MEGEARGTTATSGVLGAAAGGVDGAVHVEDEAGQGRVPLYAELCDLPTDSIQVCQDATGGSEDPDVVSGKEGNAKTTALPDPK